jgi:nucleotide-binding universal stress UspA family protein
MRIILAIDDSQFSVDAVEEVAGMRWPPDTRIRVLSAVEPMTPPPAFELWYDAGGSLEQLQKQITRRSEEVTARAADSLRESGLKAETVVRPGDPRSVIVDEATQWPADLIVVGSHGYTGIKRFLLGSVAHSVVSHAPCSVLVVRERAAEQA